MKRYVLTLSILITLLRPAISFAESSAILSLEELSIQVMPEYAYHPLDQKKDHAPLLVGYQGSMVNQSNQSQKGEIEIPLPMNLENFRIGYVADYSADLSKAYEIHYVLHPEKGTISWITSEEIKPKERYKFVVEFYTSSLEVNKDKKSLAYQFKSFADIGLVNITFTQPNQSKNMKLTPAPSEKQNADGIHTFSYLFQDVKAGEVKSFTLEYMRSETKPTVEMINNQNEEDKKTHQPSTPFTVSAFSGIGLLSVGALILLIRNRKKSSKIG